MANTAEINKNIPSQAPKGGKMPAAIPYIVGNEAAERFNFYGLRAILATFIAAQFYHFKIGGDAAVNATAEATANQQAHDFVALCYLTPLIGAMLADWFWGKYKTILYLSIVYLVGNVVLALSVDTQTAFMAGLAMVAIGTGGIKPCVSANVGDQFDETNQHLISKGFDAFYFSINLGSFFSILLIPYLKSHFSPAVAFAVPAFAMGLATLVFVSGSPKYVKVPPKGDSNKLVILLSSIVTLAFSYYLMKDGGVVLGSGGGMGPVLLTWGIMIAITALVLQKWWFANPGNFVGINLFALTNGGFDAAIKRYGAETVVGIKSVWSVLAVFAFIPFFWALWDQSNGNEWTMQAQHMDLHVLGFKMEAEQISVANALLILVFIPIFSFGIYPGIEKLGIKVTPLRRIGAGFFVTALSFVLSAMIQRWIDAGATPTIGWQLLAYVLLTAGEILVSITGLEYAYTQAPPTMKSTISACWLVAVTMGNVFDSLVQNSIRNHGFFARFQGEGFFWFFSGACACAGIVFALVTPFIKEKRYAAN